MTSMIPPDLVFTFDQLKLWLEEVESFAKAIPPTHANYNISLFMQECTGAIRIAATFNNEVGSWRDNRVTALMDRCAVLRHEAEGIVTLIQQNKASSKGSAKKKEQAFDIEGFLKEAADLIAKHPKWSKLRLANKLSETYNRTPDYLSRFLPKKK